MSLGPFAPCAAAERCDSERWLPPEEGGSDLRWFPFCLTLRYNGSGDTGVFGRLGLGLSERVLARLLARDEFLNYFFCCEQQKGPIREWRLLTRIHRVDIASGTVRAVLGEILSEFGPHVMVGDTAMWIEGWSPRLSVSEFFRAGHEFRTSEFLERGFARQGIVAMKRAAEDP
jgi:hypothetical protein